MEDDRSTALHVGWSSLFENIVGLVQIAWASIERRHSPPRRARECNHPPKRSTSLIQFNSNFSQFINNR
jgi:hypothetical protein